MAGHLIHIGYPKTGSTYLQRWFAANPQLGYAEWGIAGFENVFAAAASAVGAPPVSYRVTSFEGFATPLASFMIFDARRPDRLIPTRQARSELCRTLSELFPNAKILLVTRGFRELVLSSYSELVRGGLECSFRQFCGFLAELIRSGENPFDFDFLIGLYEQAFGEANLIVLPYELLRREPGAFLAELEKRLELEPGPALTERVNPSFSAEELYWYPRIARFLRSLPVSEHRRLRLFGWHVAAARRNRFQPLIRLLAHLRPSCAVTADDVPPALIRMFAGKSERLRLLPLYDDFGPEYLFDAAHSEPAP